MNKKILIAIVVVIAVISGITSVLLVNKFKNQPKNDIQKTEKQNPISKLTPLTAKYLVEADFISLENGKAQTINPYGATKMTTEIVGQPVSGDLNSDGKADYAVVLKQQTENDPAIYYYAAVALTDEAKNLIVGSNAVALGEGIKIENISITNQAVRINYLERKITGDAVEKEPTVPVSKSYILNGAMFKELTAKRANAQAEAACTDNNGTWNKDKNACANITKELCQKFGGKPSENLCKF